MKGLNWMPSTIAPYHPGQRLSRRKTLPTKKETLLAQTKIQGMLLQAAEDFQYWTWGSPFMIGDRASDIEAGKKCRSDYDRSFYLEMDFDLNLQNPDYLFLHLKDAVKFFW